MANEFKHKDPGTEITQAEYISSSGDGHIFACQATGDILYASSTTVLKNLGKGAANTVLNMGGSCIPAWTASPSVTDLTIGGGCITLSAATDIDLLDDTASALSFDATGKTGIIDIVTTNGSEGVTMSGTLGVTGLLTAGSLDVDDVLISGTTIGHTCDTDLMTVGNACLTIKGAVTVGVDDTGHDVKFFGAAAGAYMLYDQSCDQLEIRGASADATTSTGKLLLTTALTDINANDVIGSINFQAPAEAGGTDAVAIAAGIRAVAQATFTCAVNATDLIFYTGHSEAATEKFRFTSQGELGVGGANYGTDGQVLTSTGAGTAPAWEDASGAVTALNNATANELITVGATTTELCAEATLTYNGSVLDISTGTNVSAGIVILSCDVDTTASVTVKTKACGTDGGPVIVWQEGAGSGQDGNQYYNMGYRPSCDFFRFFSNSKGGAGSGGNIFTVAKNSGNLSLENNHLLNVGASTNDWTSSGIDTAGYIDLNNGSGSAFLTVETTATNTVAQVLIKTAASSNQVNDILFVQGSGNGSANNMGWNLGYFSCGAYFRLRSNDTDGSSTDACIFRVGDGQTTIDANTTWDANVFDDHDDAMVLWRAFSPEGQRDLASYALGKAALRTTKSELADIGVLKRYYKKCGAICEDFLGYNDQRMAALLAGGIYQTRFTVDKNHECHEARLKALEAKIG